jgi:pimeloyl-ACP methyl ester carboxylesterase
MDVERTSVLESRRTFLTVAGTALLAGFAPARHGWAQGAPGIGEVQTPALRIAYEDSGDAQGFPIVLLHGFPDDVRAWDGVVPALVNAGYRALTPYLRGFGPTRFRDAVAPRMAEQAALGQDLMDFVDALGLKRFAVAGYDWGGRAASIAAALHPDRMRAAVIIGGYTIQNVFSPPAPGVPRDNRERWYQWYFNTDVGRMALTTDRRALCRFLWETWSPGWRFSDATFNRTAGSFDNPDFVDVVIHSYRHRIANAPGEPRFEAMEKELARRPRIQVPSALLYGGSDPLARARTEASADERALFPQLVTRRVIPGAGHFLPRENPAAVSSAMLELLAQTR